MSDEARKHLNDLRDKIGKNDLAIHQLKQKRLEGTVALKIIKVVKLALTSKPDVDKLFKEADVQAQQIVNYLRENL